MGGAAQFSSTPTMEHACTSIRNKVLEQKQVTPQANKVKKALNTEKQMIASAPKTEQRICTSSSKLGQNSEQVPAALC